MNKITNSILCSYICAPLWIYDIIMKIAYEKKCVVLTSMCLKNLKLYNSIKSYDRYICFTPRLFCLNFPTPVVFNN